MKTIFALALAATAFAAAAAAARLGKRMACDGDAQHRDADDKRCCNGCRFMADGLIGHWPEILRGPCRYIANVIDGRSFHRLRLWAPFFTETWCNYP